MKRSSVQFVRSVARLHWFCLFLLFASSACFLDGANSGDTVVIIYNRRLSDSKKLAEYYASRRQVPAPQIFGLDLPLTETMTRSEYQELLLHPLVKALEKGNLLTFVTDMIPASEGQPRQAISRVQDAKIRYAVLCYGVPVRILEDTNFVEKAAEQLRPEIRRNVAAVDSELALLPISKNSYMLAGPAGNTNFAATNAAALNPTNGVLIVTRLDGPSPAIARGLVDKAIQAETNGLWGRAYFDARGLTNGAYFIGDEMIKAAAANCRRLGFQTIVDDKPETFTAAFPMSQIAIYVGWYDGNVSGPFTRPKVDFMPGAFAYHLHSFSAHVLRSPNQYWVGPLLDKGATVTMGCVDEPFLEWTPNIAVFCLRLLQGFTFGEAACAAQGVLSWQTTVVGDPLYCPFGKPARNQHADLLLNKSKLIEWSYLRVVNLNQAMGMATPKLIYFLENLIDTRKSPVLLEKLGDLYAAEGEKEKSVKAYTDLLNLNPAPLQRVRVMLELSDVLAREHREAPSYEWLQKFLKECGDYPDKLAIYQKLLTLARTLNKSADAAYYQRQIDRFQKP